jgi:hypothetical protein
VQTLLGVVTGTKSDKRGDPVAWVKPLLDVTTATWQQVDPEEYPTRGFLFWPRANDAIVDAFVFVRPKESTVRTPGNKDNFMVVEPHAALEVLDLRRFGNEERIRTSLAGGMRLPANPPGRTLIWCEEDVVVGPVTLLVGSNGITIDKNNRSRIPCFHLRPEDIRTVVYDGLTRQVYVKPSLGQPDSFVDWDDNKQVVRRAIEFAVELARKSGTNVSHAKQLVEEATEVLTSDASSPDLLLSLYRLERARSVVGIIEQSNGFAGEIVGTLRQHPAILKEFEDLKASERASARIDTESTLRKEQEEIGRLERERATAESALAEVTRALQEAQAEALRKAGEIEGQIRARIAGAISSAPALLAEVSVLRPFIRDGGAPPSQGAASSGRSYQPWKLGSNLISTAKELRNRILPILKSVGVPALTYQRLHAAFAANLLPVIAGTKAIDALNAYAHVATGGRILIVQATPSLTDPGDVFGRLDSAGNRFLPHAAGLIDVVLAAKQSQGLMLVVLDGANRGATESYLLPLVRSALRRSAPTAVFHPSALDSESPYQAGAWIEWPRNLLLAATLVEGPTTLPVAPDLWADSILVSTDTDEKRADPMHTVTPDLSEIDPNSNLLVPGEAGEPPTDPLDGLVKSSSVRDVGSRFERALRVFQTDSTALQLEVVKAVLVPRLASIENDDERASEVSEAQKSLGSKGPLRLSEEVDAARRRIG